MPNSRAADSAQVAVIGGGPAGLMAAETLASSGAQVTVYDRMPSVGRKFLLAGRGGLNLTHSENIEQFLARYGDAATYLRAAIDAFPPDKLRAWSESLGQETFIGSSGRVFPKALKTSPLLRAWLARLNEHGVAFRMRHRWTGWSPTGALEFESPDHAKKVASADATIIALGGASWPRLGSDGSWSDIFAQAGIPCSPLRPANCGFLVPWSDIFRDRFEGQPLKRIALSFGDHVARGEAVVTRTGIEGGAVYALSAQLREAIIRTGEAILTIDLRPDISKNDLAARLGGPRKKQSLSTFLRKAVNLDPVAIGLLQEVSAGRLSELAPGGMAGLIKALPLRLTGAAPIEKAISTAGGLPFDELDQHFMLRRKPGVFVAGEMLDWEAPTGGYLLQAAFATGAAAGQGALAWLKRSDAA